MSDDLDLGRLRIRFTDDSGVLRETVQQPRNDARELLRRVEALVRAGPRNLEMAGQRIAADKKLLRALDAALRAAQEEARTR